MWDKITAFCVAISIIGLYWLGLLCFFSLLQDICRELKNGYKWVVRKFGKED